MKNNFVVPNKEARKLALGDLSDLSSKTKIVF